jgi:hypothetical protein
VGVCWHRRYDPLPVDSVTVFMSVEELQKAAEAGANGVVFGSVEEGRTTWNALTGLSTSDREGTAFAIRWWVKRGEGDSEH